MHLCALSLSLWASAICPLGLTGMLPAPSYSEPGSSGPCASTCGFLLSQKGSRWRQSWYHLGFTCLIFLCAGPSWAQWDLCAPVPPP